MRSAPPLVGRRAALSAAGCVPMGILDKFTSLFAPRKSKVRVICVGLDNSGKSTVINYLKPKKVRCRRLARQPPPPRLTLPPLWRVARQSTAAEVGATKPQAGPSGPVANRVSIADMKDFLKRVPKNVRV